MSNCEVEDWFWNVNTDLFSESIQFFNNMAELNGVDIEKEVPAVINRCTGSDGKIDLELFGLECAPGLLLGFGMLCAYAGSLAAEDKNIYYAFDMSNNVAYVRGVLFGMSDAGATDDAGNSSTFIVKKKRIDDWAQPIIDTIEEITESGEKLNAVKVWTRLVSSPPHGYRITHKDGVLEMPGCPGITKEALKKRLSRYTGG